MRTVLPHAAGLLLAGLLASAVHAADPKPVAAPAAAPVMPDIHRMVIFNGPTRTVHYFSVGLSTSDQAALRDLERAENEADYADDLQNLRRQYVAQEIALAPRRADVQQALYGQSITQSYDYQTALNYGPGYYGMGYPYYTGYGYQNGYGYNSVFAGSTSSVNQSLAYGVGDEGALKTAMAPVIAAQATAEYATSAGRAYTAALNRAGESEVVQTVLGIGRRGPGFAEHTPRAATLTLKPGLGDKIDGNIVDEDNDTITVETPTDQVTVRKADVVMIARHKSK